jgi:hypothetical protein
MISRFFLKLIESGDCKMTFVNNNTTGRFSNLENTMRALVLTFRGEERPTPREQRIFAGVAAVSFAAFACFTLKVHQDRAANANAALQGVGGNPIALVSASQQKGR